MACKTQFYGVLPQLMESLFVLHVNNNHWICVAGNKNNEIPVYDSMGGNLSQDTVHVIARMVKCEEEEFMVKLMPVQHQTNGNDCGLFALAFATDFAEGIDPSERYYDEKDLRNHLLQCFRNNEINQFPHKDISAKSKPSKIVYKVYELFCICRGVFFQEDIEKEPENSMAECSKCGEWYHRKCEVIPKEVFVKPNATW